MLGLNGRALYVGKARNLKRRVASYTRLRSHGERISQMIRETSALEIITTHTEAEALLLEANLIKRLRPRYNVVLRDDKSHPYILLSAEHAWARLIKHRGARSRKGEYFGPFASAGAVNRTLASLQRAFPLRNCSDNIFQSRTRPCLQYQIKRCTAPCVGRIQQNDYISIVDEARKFLTGHNRNMQETLSRKMQEASDNLDYEAAAIFRDRIKALTQIQAQAILDMQLRRIAALERERIEEEYQQLQKTITELEALLADPQKVLAEVKKETRKVRKDYGDDRRTEILDEEPEAPTREDLIPHQDMVITITQRGYVKRMPLDTYRAQHRGGRGVTGMVTREADVLQHLIVADTHDTLLFFTTRGKAYSLRCFELPQDVTRSTRGMPAVNLLAIAEGERITAVLTTTKDAEEDFIMMATRKGEIKRMAYSRLANIRSNGLITMDLEPEDELVSVRAAREGDEVVMVTQMGMAARFPIDDVRQSSRYAGGVRGIRLDINDRVMSMEVVLPEAQLFVVSQKGFGKLTPIQAYRKTKRRNHFKTVPRSIRN